MYEPNINVNTGKLVSQTEFQVCVPNNFYIILLDQFGVVVELLPDLSANFTFTINGVTISNYTVQNTKTPLRNVTLTYCGPIGDGKGVLNVTLTGTSGVIV